MSTIHIQLLPRGPSLNQGDTITLRFPLDAAHPDRDLTISEDLLPLLEDAELNYYVPTSLAPGSARLRQSGQTLYRWLDGADRFLARVINEYRGSGRAVALLIEAGIGLDHLPWELLHDGDYYLVAHPQTAVIPVRWQVGRVPDTPFYTTPQNRPLHVAFMASAPEDAGDTLDFEGEEAHIVTTTARDPLRLSVEESGNLAELGYLLAGYGAGHTDIVHLTGHATHTADGPRFLCEDEVGGPHRASAAEIHRALTHTPRLLFLSGCRTGQSMEGGSVASLAAELVAAGIPAVLGWGQPVYDTDATAAAALLYAGLAQGLTPVRALADRTAGHRPPHQGSRPPGRAHP